MECGPLLREVHRIEIKMSLLVILSRLPECHAGQRSDLFVTAGIASYEEDGSPGHLAGPESPDAPALLALPVHQQPVLAGLAGVDGLEDEGLVTQDDSIGHILINSLSL